MELPNSDFSEFCFCVLFIYLFFATNVSQIFSNVGRLFGLNWKQPIKTVVIAPHSFKLGIVG